jgi:flagellar M-ring protein FliF
LQQLIGVWRAIDLRRRVIVIAATAATFAAVLLMANVASQSSLALLYTGLDATRAGEVVAALEQRGVTHEVRGEAIYVDAARRDELRMTLAAEGLPATGGTGYELLDSLTGFGTTAQMFDAAYWRAKEGELARTIAAIPQIRSARVHISNQDNAGLRTARPGKAAVTVKTSGSGLPAAQVRALRYLVASAVAGMAPEDVAVIDADRGLLPPGDDAAGTMAGDDRAAVLKANVERLLEARVGPGKAVVELSVDTVTEREAITERRVDPQSRVAISTDTTESSTNANDSRGSAVTVASNLPQGAGAGTGGASQSQKNDTRERTNFEVSETTREVLRNPGAIRRLTVAVLVDGVMTPDAAGTPVWTPRPDEELASLRDLVASTVGFDEARGDIITLKSLPFEPVAAEGTEVASGLLSGMVIDLMAIARIVVPALVALILGLFVLRPILTARSLPTPARLAGLPAPASASAYQTAPGPALTGEIDDRDFLPPNMAVVSDFGGGPGASRSGLASGGGFAASGDGDAGDPVTRLRRMIADRQDETVEILRGWIDTPGREQG